MAVLNIKEAEKALENAPEGAQFWTPGYDVEYRMLSGVHIYGYQPDGHWMKAKDQGVAQERIDKGWYIPNLVEKVAQAKSVDGVDVTTVITPSNEEFGLPFVVENASTIIEACEKQFGAEGEFHVHEIHEAKTIHIITTKNGDNVAKAGMIASKFDMYDDATKVMVRVVPNLTKAVEDLYPVHEPFLAQQIGRALRKPEPKEGEWWICECKNIPGKVDGYSYESALFLNGTVWCFDSEGFKPVPFETVPLNRMYTQEELHNIVTEYQNQYHLADKQCREHADAVTKLSEGLSIITDACKERGLGDRPYVDIVQLLLEAERKIIEPKIYDAPALYPLVEDAYYMCKFEFKGGTATEPLKWRGGGWFFGEKPLSQTTNNPEPLYRMVKSEPKEMVTLQLDGLPPIGSTVYIIPNREAGNGKPGFKSDNAGRKVEIHSHFTDSRGVDLAAYVTCDDKHPYVGGVACATAFETENEKREREIDVICNDLKEGSTVTIGERALITKMYDKGYSKGDNNA